MSDTIKLRTGGMVTVAAGPEVRDGEGKPRKAIKLLDGVR